LLFCYFYYACFFCIQLHFLPVLRDVPVRLTQILHNLIGDAVKFTDHGSVTPTPTLERTTSGFASMHFSVTDTGIGIPADKLNAIFRPLNKQMPILPVSTVGLGAAITKWLLQLQESQITIESSLRKGSTCSFTLQLRKADRPAASE
jgi:signal transduction histidine kinase